MTLRDYQPGDFARLCEIDRRCFQPRVAYTAREMRAILRRGSAVAIVAENPRGEVVAFVVAHRQKQTRGSIVTLDVLPGYRGRGVGRRLMQECEQRLAAAGATMVRLETAAGNRPAQALYRSLGYTFVKRLPRYYASGEDAWVMEKVLPGERAGPDR